MGVEIISKCDSMTGRDLMHFVLAIAVECGPIDALVLPAPVEGGFLSA